MWYKKLSTRGTHLELDRVIPDKGLVCLAKQRTKSQLLLNPKGSGQFLLLPDTTEYTVQYVVEHFPLPQTVAFINTGSFRIETSYTNTALGNAYTFKGTYELIDYKTQTVIIGQSKPYLKARLIRDVCMICLCTKQLK